MDFDVTVSLIGQVLGVPNVVMYAETSGVIGQLMRDHHTGHIKGSGLS